MRGQHGGEPAEAGNRGKDMNKTDILQERDRISGIRLGRFHTVTAALFAVLALLLLLSTYLTGRGYTRAEEATERYITAQQAAADMQAASDYLTAEARGFIATGNPARASRFFEEVNSIRRRDRALEEIEKILDNPSAYAYLSAAKDSSDELLEIECYAMRLAAESYGSLSSELPEKLRTLILNDADLRLSSEEQRDKALEMVFDETYQGYKDAISRSVSLSVEALIDETRAEQLESAAQLLLMIRRERVLIIAMLLLALLLVLSTVRLVTRPLQNYIRHIRLDETLPEEGASELRFLARTYNEVRAQNIRRREQLNYDATHDALTGVFNRGVFEKLRTRFDGQDKTLLIVDIDRFKQINDRYGHDVGDRALCYVAALLQESFRAEDYICRIGGDEFVVIMVHTGSSLRGMVESKFRRINERLQTPMDGLPPISLSVGVAFGDRENPGDDIFKDADTALYRTKSVRLGGIEFY